MKRPGRPTRLTGCLFAWSDLCAWLLLYFSLFGALAYPFVAPITARMQRTALPIGQVCATCVLWLVVAVGAHALARRKAHGLPLVALPALPLAAMGRFGPALWYLAVVFLVFVLPVLLAWREARAAGLLPRDTEATEKPE